MKTIFSLLQMRVMQHHVVLAAVTNAKSREPSAMGFDCNGMNNSAADTYPGWYLDMIHGFLYAKILAVAFTGSFI
jgi:hypothetical protein